jgi:hypothetical protein
MPYVPAELGVPDNVSLFKLRSMICKPEYPPHPPTAAYAQFPETVTPRAQSGVSYEPLNVGFDGKCWI